MERQAEAAAAIAGPATVDDTRHGGLHVEPAIAARGAEADQQLFPGEDALLRGDEHPLRGEVEGEVGDETEVTLADHLAREEHLPAKSAARLLPGEDDAHRCTSEARSVTRVASAGQETVAARPGCHLLLRVSAP